MIDALTETMHSINAPLYRFLIEAFFLFCGFVLIPLAFIALVLVLISVFSIAAMEWPK